MVFLKMAWRNIWRNMRRTLITICMFAIGAAFGILILSFIYGYHEIMVSNSIKSHTGHIQIHKNGYNTFQNIKYFIRKDKLPLQVIEDEKEVKNYAFRIKCSGLVSYTNKCKGVMIVGIEPDKEKKITVLQNPPRKHHPGALIEGEDLNENDYKEGKIQGVYRWPGLLLGDEIAKNFNLSIGYKVVLTAQALNKEINQKIFIVKGIFRTLDSKYDGGMVVIHIKNAQQIFNYKDDYISEVVLSLQKNDEVDLVKQSLISKIDTNQYEVLSWKDLSPQLLQLITLDNIQVEGTAIIFFIIVSVGILIALIMSIFERFREYGVMMAMGISSNQLVRLIIYENIFLTIIGCVLGCLIAFPIAYHYHTEGMDFSSFVEGAELFAITLDTTVYFDLSPSVLLGPLPFILFFSILIALYPALKVVNLNVVEAIRY